MPREPVVWADFTRLRARLGLSAGRYNSILLTYSDRPFRGSTEAGRGGFMRRFLTLVFMLCLAIPAGISISGCTRNPAAKYCHGLGYGLKNTDVASITLQPQTTGISLAFGQTTGQSPTALTCTGSQRQWTATSTPTAPPTTSWLTSRPPATSAPAPGTATPAAASPTTPIAIFPILCPRPAACPTHGLHHGFGRLGDFQPGRGLRPCPGDFGGPCGSAAMPLANAGGTSRRAGLLQRNGQQYLLCAPSR